MSKKNKKNKNVWDINVDEQSSSADNFYKKYGASIFDVGKQKKEKPLDEQISTLCSGGTKQAPVTIGMDSPEPEINLDKMILSGKMYDTAEEPEEEVGTDGCIVLTKEEKNIIHESLQHQRTISLLFNTALNKIIVDNKIIQTPYSLEYMMVVDSVNTSDLNTDELIDDLFTYIILRQHPTAILTTEEFNAMIKNVDDFSKDKFIVAYHDGDYIIYHVDPEAKNELMNFINSLDYDIEDTLKVLISLSVTVGMVNNAFFIEDRDYVDLFKSTYNDVNETIITFRDDPETRILDDTAESTGDVRSRVINARDAITDVFMEIDRITNDDDDDEDEETHDSSEREYESDDKNDEETPDSSEQESNDMADDAFTNELLDGVEHDSVKESINSSSLQQNKPIVVTTNRYEDSSIPLSQLQKSDDVTSSEPKGSFVIPVVRKNK